MGGFLDERKRTLFAGMIAILIIFALFSGFWKAISSDSGTVPVLWPSPTLETPGTKPSNIILVNGYQQVQLTTKTVQAVIETLKRPEQYSQNILLTVYWGQEEKGTVSVVSSTMNGYAAAKITQMGQVQYNIWGKGTLYRWYEGDQNWYQGELSFMNNDLLQRIPTYETVLSLNSDQILSAGYVTLDQKTCIYVESSESSSNSQTCYWIDAMLGLLVRAESYIDDQMIWCVEISDITTSDIDKSVFCLPNGTDVRNVSS